MPAATRLDGLLPIYRTFTAASMVRIGETRVARDGIPSRAEWDCGFAVGQCICTPQMAGP